MALPLIGLNMQTFFMYVLIFNNPATYYIGSTGHLDKRLNRHFRELENGVHHNSILQSRWNIFPNQEVNISAIETPSLEKARLLEDKWIKSLRNNPYFSDKLANIGNDSIGGDNLTFNPARSTIIDKITLSVRNRMGKMLPEEKVQIFGRKGDKNGMFGRTHSLETRKLLSEKMKGHSYTKGRKLSTEHIEKIRQMARLRTGEKNSFYGKHHSPETIERLRKAGKGKIPANARSLLAGNILFKSCADASRYYKISRGLVTYRIKSLKYPNWLYIENG